jgi:hypothetical protein
VDVRLAVGVDHERHLAFHDRLQGHEVEPAERRIARRARLRGTAKRSRLIEGAADQLPLGAARAAGASRTLAADFREHREPRALEDRVVTQMQQHAVSREGCGP